MGVLGDMDRDGLPILAEHGGARGAAAILGLWCNLHPLSQSSPPKAQRLTMMIGIDPPFHTKHDRSGGLNLSPVSWGKTGDAKAKLLMMESMAIARPV